MSKQVADVKITDNSKEILRMMAEREDVILDAIGQKAASNARGYLRASGAIDTAYLRNGVAYAVSGKSAITEKGGSTYSADRGGRTGEYSGTAPNDPPGKKAVYIGSNAEYAIPVETGTARMPARPFIKPAAENHKDEYKAIALRYMKQG